MPESRSPRREMKRHMDHLRSLAEQLMNEIRGDGSSHDVDLFRRYETKWKFYVRKVKTDPRSMVELREDGFESYISRTAKELKRKLNIHHGRSNRFRRIRTRIINGFFLLVLLALIVLVFIWMKQWMDLNTQILPPVS